MDVWSTACPDWEGRLIGRRPLIPFGPLFPDEAEASLEVFRALRVADVAGQPTVGECCAPWVINFAAAVFGCYDHDTGRRMIREFFLLVSKKNGKSTIAAGIMLTALIRNWRNSAEFLIVAPTIEVAGNSFKPASDMVKADQELSDLLHVNANTRTITHRVTGATLKVVAADNDTVSGKKATGVLIDELWLFGKRANADAMLREATGGLASRPEGFVINLSTMSDAPPAGVFKQKLDYFRNVRDGVIEDRKSLPIIYEFPPDMVKAGAHLAPENFYVTNPNLGLSVDREFLEDEMGKAKAAGLAELTTFAAKHLNIEIGVGLRTDNWAGAEFWEAASDPNLTLDRLIAESEVIVAGVDGGGLDDLLGLAFLGRHKVTRKWMVWSHAWAHERVLDRRKGEASVLRGFERDGDLTIVSDMTDAFQDLAERCSAIWEKGLLAEVGMDPAGVGLIIEEFAALGMPTELPFIVGVRQGWTLQGAIKTAEVKVSNGDMVHCGQPIMAWSVGNAKTEMKGSALMITKQISGSAKIDPLMAMFDAVARMSANPVAANGPSIYERVEERPAGLLVI